MRFMKSVACFLVAALTSATAHAQVSSTRASLESQAETCIIANGTGLITQACVLSLVLNTIASEVTQADASNILNGSGIVVANGGGSPLTFTPPATGIMAFLAQPSSVNLLAAMTDSTGTAGHLVFSVSPALTGAPTAPTQTTADTSSTIATDAFVHNVAAAASATSLPSATSSQIYVGTGAAGAAAVASTLPTAAVPAFTGDVTNSAGSLTTVVGHVNGVAYGTSPSTNTVPVVTGSNAITYEAVPNAALAHSLTTVNGIGCTLGSTCTIATGSPSITNASGSSQSTTGTISASSAALTLAAAQDFVNGEGIRINHAGAAFTRGAPSALSVTPTGTAGTTHYTYTIASLDANGGVGTPIATVTTTTGNATLSTTNYNALSWTGGTGTPALYAVYGPTSGCTTTNCPLRAIVKGTTYNDVGWFGVGAPDWLPTTPQASALADWLVTTISSGGGTTSLTLAANATTAASGQGVLHDDTAAVQAALTTYVAGGTFSIPCGSYSLTSQLSGTIPANKSMKVAGGGQDCAVLNFINGNGLLINYAAVSSSSTWEDLSIVTNITGLGIGLEFNSQFFTTLPAFPSANSLNNVTFRGADSYYTNSSAIGYDYWSVDMLVSAVNGISFYNDTFFGDYAQNGIGVQLVGIFPNCNGSGTNCYAEVYNFISCNFAQQNQGISYGEYVQGVQISSSNFTNLNPGDYAVYVANSTGDDELAISNSQFGQTEVFDGTLNGFTSNGSLYIIATNGVGILIAGQTWSITGNTFSGESTTNNNGIYCGSGGIYGVATANAFNNLGTGIALVSGCNNNNVQANAYYSNVTTQVFNSGSGNSVGVATK